MVIRLATYTILAVVSRGVFRAVFGDTVGASVIGILLGIYVGRVLISRWDAREQETQKETAQALSQQSDKLDQERKDYSVVYRQGHRGIDHYLRVYLKQSTLNGTLTLSRAGVKFVCRSTPTEQKFTLAWSQVESAEYTNIAGWLSSKPGFRIASEEYRSITFAAPEAVQIVADTRAMARLHRERLAEQRRLEEEQIKSRNLDAVSPITFERLVGQLFESMGYHVKHTGGSSDHGIDLSCSKPGAPDTHVIVQCKRYKHKVGVRTIRAFYGVLVDCGAETGYVVTTGRFTEPARSWAEDKPIALIDRCGLARLLDKHLSSKDGPRPAGKQLTLFD